MQVYKHIWSRWTIYGRDPVQPRANSQTLGIAGLARDGMLGPHLRRDLTVLNHQFLEISLGTDLTVDPHHAWSEPVRARLLATDAATRERMSSSPVSFFELVLPADATTKADTGRVEEAGRPDERSAVAGPCLAFLHLALFLARSLVDSAPLATRLALGIPPAVQRVLNETSTSDLMRLAACPGLVRPRWPGHCRYWELLATSARHGSDTALQWAHWMGICLLGASLGTQTPGDPIPGPRGATR